MLWTVGSEVFAAISPTCPTAAMAKKKDAPTGFGRRPMPDEASDISPDGHEPQPLEKQLEPPLANPVFVGTTEMYELFQRYDIQPLTPVSAFEMQLVQIIGGLEKRIRQLDHDY